MKNRILKISSVAIAARGIDEAHAISLMRRRARAALLRDRTKVFASTPLGSIPIFGRHADGRAISVHDINADLLTLKLASDEFLPMATTRDYVAVWCRLNHLKEC